jgi:hypothetical protein
MWHVPPQRFGLSHGVSIRVFSFDGGENACKVGNLTSTDHISMYQDQTNHSLAEVHHIPAIMTKQVQYIQKNCLLMPVPQTAGVPSGIIHWITQLSAAMRKEHNNRKVLMQGTSTFPRRGVTLQPQTTH